LNEGWHGGIHLKRGEAPTRIACSLPGSEDVTAVTS